MTALLGTGPAGTVLAVSQTWRTFGLLLVAVLLIGFAVYLWFNIRSARDEIGSEIELAANRATPPPDELLEGRRLERVQFWGVLFLIVVAIGLPLYWLREPGRQAGAITQTEETAIDRGETSYLEGFQCSNCHGADGSGGAAPYILPIPLFDDDGQRVVDEEGTGVNFNVAVNWTAPDLTSVLSRYSHDEVREILVYGRTNSPMPPWGVEGGGVGTDQEIENVIEFLEEIQRDPDDDIIPANREAFENAMADGGPDFDGGEWLFKEHCARCHTQGWAWAENLSAETYADLVADLPPGVELPVGPQGGGAFGPRLDGDGLREQFVTADEQIDFISVGSEDHVAYGTRGLGAGQMPGFGLMLDEELIALIVEYERQLDPDNDPVDVPGADGEAESGLTPAQPDEEGITDNDPGDGVINVPGREEEGPDESPDLGDVNETNEGDDGLTDGDNLLDTDGDDNEGGA